MVSAVAFGGCAIMQTSVATGSGARRSVFWGAEGGKRCLGDARRCRSRLQNSVRGLSCSGPESVARDRLSRGAQSLQLSGTGPSILFACFSGPSRWLRTCSRSGQRAHRQRGVKTWQ